MSVTATATELTDAAPPNSGGRPRDVATKRRVIDAIVSIIAEGAPLNMRAVQKRAGASYFQCIDVRKEMQSTGEIDRLREQAKAHSVPSKSAPHRLSDDAIRQFAVNAAGSAIRAGEPPTLGGIIRFGAKGSYARIKIAFCELVAEGQIPQAGSGIAPARMTGPGVGAAKHQGGPALDRQPATHQVRYNSPLDDEIRSAKARERARGRQSRMMANEEVSTCSG